MGALAWAKVKLAGVLGDPKQLGPIGSMVTGAVPYAMPPVRGSRELMRAAGRQPWLYAVTERIGASLAAVPWELYVARNAKGKPDAESAKRYSHMRAEIIASPGLQTWQRRKDLSDLRREENLDRLTTHPLLDIFDKPNPVMTGYQFRKFIARMMDLSGECMGIIERNPFGMPVQMFPTPSFWCLRTPAPDYGFFQFSYNLFQREIPASEVLWLKHLDLENPYARGIGAGFAVADVVETFEYALKTEKAFFYNNGLPAGMMTLEGASDEQLAAARADWEGKYRGFWNAMRLAWTGFKATFTPFSAKFADQELQKLIEAKRDTIIEVYGVPPEILGIIKNSNKATSMVAKGIYAEQVLTPRLEDMRGIFQSFLVPEYDDSLVLEYVSPIPDDRSFDLDVGKVAPNSRTLNEWRDLGNLDPWDGPEGDELFIPAGKLPAGEGDASASPTEPAKHAVVEVRAIHHPEPQKQLSRGAGDDGLDKDAIQAALDAIDESEFDPVTGLFKKQVAKWGTRVFEELGVDAEFDMSNPAVDDYLSMLSSEKITGINDTTKAAVRERLSNVYENGGSVRDAMREIREVFRQATGDEMSRGRAERIARTEVVAASNAGSHAAFKQSGVVEKKEWIHTSGQDAPRDGEPAGTPDHEAMDGQVVGLDEDFTDPGTGEKAMYPGAFASADQVVNCGCAHWAKIDDPADKRLAFVKVRSNAERAAMLLGWRKAWLASAESEVRRAFKRQLSAVLATLK